MSMTQEEEMLVQQKLNEIMEKLGISEEEFQRSTMFHGQDQRKGMQIMQMQQQTQASSAGRKDVKPLTKEKVMEVFKVQQEIQMESMDEMLNSGMGFNEPNTPDAQMQMMMKMMV